VSYEAACVALREIIDQVWGYCEGSGIRGRTVTITLKVKFSNFQPSSRRKRAVQPRRAAPALTSIASSTS
jgi:DNA polymerase-4